MVRYPIRNNCTATTPTVSADSTSYADVTITGDECYANITYTISERTSDEELRKIKLILKKEAILKMKKTWNNLKKQFESVPPIRPDIQLRGVCLGGRGWA